MKTPMQELNKTLKDNILNRNDLDTNDVVAIIETFYLQAAKDEIEQLRGLINKVYNISDSIEFSPEKIREIKTAIEIHRALTKDK